MTGPDRIRRAVRALRDWQKTFARGAQTEQVGELSGVVLGLVIDMAMDRGMDKETFLSTAGKCWDVQKAAKARHEPS